MSEDYNLLEQQPFAISMFVRGTPHCLSVELLILVSFTFLDFFGLFAVLFFLLLLFAVAVQLVRGAP